MRVCWKMLVYMKLFIAIPIFVTEKWVEMPFWGFLSAHDGEICSLQMDVS